MQGGKGRRSHYITTTEGDVYFKRGEKVITRNSFSALADDFDLKKRKPTTPICKKEDISKCKDFLIQDHDLLFYDILSYDLHYDSLSVLSNKDNMCSGYFPSFITLDDINFLEQYNNVNDSIPKYYPYIINGKYKKTNLK